MESDLAAELLCHFVTNYRRTQEHLMNYSDNFPVAVEARNLVCTDIIPLELALES